MKTKGYIHLLLFFVAAPLTLYGQSIQFYNEILEQGQEIAARGDAPEALELWREVITDSEDPLTDPRIGRRAIELATDHDLQDYYELGQNAYFWGLRNPSSPVFRRELEQEIERLEPIADPELFKRWEQYMREEAYRELGESIELFWESLDPTLDTPFNERLVEHWNRIDYSRDNFTKSNTTVYGADDRATIYVRFGEPDYKRAGQMNYNSAFTRMWIADAVESTLRESEDNGFNDEEDSLSSSAIQARMRRNRNRRATLITNFEREVRVEHTYPDYEIWVYREMLQRENENLIYIFGDEGTSGTFGLRRSIDEMIPSSTFRPNRDGMNIPPSFFLQLMYYQEVINIDFYFAEAFQDLENVIYRPTGISRFDSHQLRSRNTARMRQTHLNAPEQRSSIVRNMPQIPIDLHQYRLLDEDNNPYLATFLLSRPHQAFYFDQVRQNIFENTEYYYKGVALTMNEQKQIFYKSNTPPRQLFIDSGFFGNINNYAPHVTYFEVPNNPDYPAQRFSIELHHQNMSSDSLGEQIFPEDLRAIGIVSSEQTEPLSTDSDQLGMGDLIVGVEEEGEFSEPFGFRVEPDATISAGESLMLHLEIYHLEGSAGNPVPFQVGYTVRANKNIFQRLFGSRDQISLELNFESRDPAFRENLEIDTTPFEPGRYTLELRVSQAGREEEIARTIDFVIE